MITIDSRKGSGELAPLFPQTIPTTLSHLDYGDFFFLGRGEGDTLVTIGVERKAIRDLVNSMVTGRFSGHQLPGLVNTYNYNYLLVEGAWRYDHRTGVLQTQNGPFWNDLCLGQRRFMAREIVSFLNTVQVKAGVMVVYTNDKTETVQTVSSLYGWWNSKNFEDHTSHLMPNKARKGSHGEIRLSKPSLVRRVAAEISGIGWGLSKVVDQYFPSVLHMVMADEREWRKIEGIGPLKAKGAVEELRKEKG